MVGDEMVIDGSVAIAWCFEEKYSLKAREILSDSSISFLAPAIFPFEVTNFFGAALRKGIITESNLSQSLSLLESLSITINPQPLPASFSALIPLMSEYDLSAYDASYLALSLNRGAALATLDKKLRLAAEMCGVVVVPNI